MSVSVTAQAVGMRPRRGVPKGLIPFLSSTTLAGDGSAGTVTFDIELNPAAGQLPMSVILTDAFIEHSGAGLMDCEIGWRDGDWIEEPGRVSGVLIDGVFRSILRIVTPEAPLNYGRVASGSSGRISIFLETNTDSTTYLLKLRGVWSAHDFILPVGLTP